MITVNKIIFLFLLLVFQLGFGQVFANRPNVQILPDDILKMRYRAFNMAMTDTDYENLETYFSNCLLQKYVISHKVLCETIVGISHIVLSDNEISYEQARRLQVYAVALQIRDYNIQPGRLKEIIWLSALRSLEDMNLLKNILGNQAETHMAKLALNLMAEYGWYPSLKIERIGINIENVKLYMELIKRKAEVINHLRNNDKFTKEALESELAKSIDEVLPTINKGELIQLRHLQWLIKKLGVYREKLIVKNILINISGDIFYYNQDRLKNLTKDEKKSMISFTEERLGIKERSERALDPYKLEPWGK